MHYRWLVAIPVVALLVLVAWPDTPQGRVEALREPVTHSAAFSLFGYPGTDVANLEAWDTGVHQAAWDEGVWRAGVEAAEAERRAAEEASARRAGYSGASSGIPSFSSHGGPHSDAWWWGVAICEQGGRNDPYFGYFSWIDGSSAGMTWDEQVAKSNALLSRVSSESPAWAPSCVAAGYRASPSG